MSATAGPAAVAQFCSGVLPASSFQEVLDGTTLFLQRVEGAGGAPAVAAVGRPGEGHVVVFTSLEALAAYAGECDWASAPGAEVLALVPAGYGVLVDAGSPSTAVLEASAIRRGVPLARSAGST